MKHWFALVMALVLLLCSGCAGGEEAYDDPEDEEWGAEAWWQFESGECLYALQDDDTVEIIYFEIGETAEVTVPTEIDGRSVTRIGEEAFIGSDVTSVTIPDSVTSIGANPFAGCRFLETIRVSPDHPTLEVVDGVLFSKPDKELLSFPMSKTGDYIIKGVNGEIYPCKADIFEKTYAPVEESEQ